MDKATSFYRITIRNDRRRNAIITEVYLLESGVYKAFSFYAKDKEEKVVGLGVSENENEAIRLSIKDLKKEWRERIRNIKCN